MDGEKKERRICTTLAPPPETICVFLELASQAEAPLPRTLRPRSQWAKSQNSAENHFWDNIQKKPACFFHNLTRRFEDRTGQEFYPHNKSPMSYFWKRTRALNEEKERRHSTRENRRKFHRIIVVFQIFVGIFRPLFRTDATCSQTFPKTVSSQSFPDGATRRRNSKRHQLVKQPF